MTTKSVLKLPTFNRILVKPLPSNMSSEIYVADRSLLIRGEIVAVGPMAGLRDGVQHHTFKKGQIVTYDRTKALNVGDVGNELSLIVDDTAFLVE